MKGTNSTSTVRVGVVGLGMVSFRHIEGFQAHDGAEVLAVCDLDEAQAEAVAKRFGIPRHFSSYAAMLDDPDINTIAIATPTFSHHALAVAAAKSGKNIFCEKPFSLSITEAQEMCEEAERAGVALAIDETHLS